ncbi:MAG: site-2 protease family protein [Candidatus Xenobia bacterium]
MNGDFIALGLVWYVVFLISTVCHEAAHALAAQLGGDETAALGGQVSLDPLPHLRREPLGMILFPILTYVTQGWMMGWASAPYDPLWADRHPRRAAWMALAGPLANFAIMLAAAITIRIGLHQGWLELPGRLGFSSLVTAPGAGGDAAGMFLSVAFSLNLLLGCFNLIPFGPLDGSAAIGLLMSEDAMRRWNAVMRSPQNMMVGMLVAWFGFGYVFQPIFMFALRHLYH